MRRIILYLLLINLSISCNEVIKEEKKTDNRLRILIGKVKTTTSDSKFFEVTNSEIVNKYFDLFVDSLNYSFVGSQDYDYRIQFFDGNKIEQEIFVFESDASFSFWGANNSTSRITNDTAWEELRGSFKALEAKLYEFKNKEVANEFYSFAKSKSVFLSIPQFRNWKEYDGELHFMADINGIAVKIDSLKEVIKKNYPDYEIKIQISDCYLSGCEYTRRVKLFSSEEFFKEFKYNDKLFPEKIRPDSVKQSFIQHVYTYYSIFGLRNNKLKEEQESINELNKKSKIKIAEYSESRTARFNKANYDFYIIYDPIIEVIADSMTILELDKWIISNKKVTE